MAISQVGIYKITIADKFYYGQSVELTKRRYKHLWHLKNNSHDNIYMQRVYNKYLDFSFEIIEIVEDISLLDSREQYYIDLYIEDANCMNLARCALSPNRGIKASDETKAKLAIAHNKQIQAILPDGTVKVWISANEAAKELGICVSTISRWCLGKRGQPGMKSKSESTQRISGYIFSYREVTND
jgi:predicted helicase